jgi:hypothetical protein
MPFGVVHHDPQTERGLAVGDLRRDVLDALGDLRVFRREDAHRSEIISLVLSHGRENVHCELFVQKPCRIKRRGALPDLEMELGRFDIAALPGVRNHLPAFDLIATFD